LVRPVERLVEARGFRGHLGFADRGAPHRELLALQPHDRAQRDPGRRGDAGEPHGSPPNLPLTSSASAVSAACSSAPSVLTLMVLPSSAASIITPMMLLPLTSRSSRLTSTCELNFAAVLTNSAQSRACS